MRAAINKHKKPQAVVENGSRSREKGEKNEVWTL